MIDRAISSARVADWWLNRIALAACLCAASLSAQVQMNLPADHAGVVKLQAQQLKDEMAFRKTPSAKDPSEQLDSLSQNIRQHPSYFETKGGVYSAADEFDRYIKAVHPEAKILEAKLQVVQTTMSALVPSFYLAAFDSEMARTLLKQNTDLPAAKSLAESGIASHDHDDCLQDDRYGAESHHVYDESAAKHSVPFTYHVEEGQQHCAKLIASRYAVLGKIEATQGDIDAASLAFNKALHEYPNVDAALGFATIDRAKGDESDELEMFDVAFLTGALSPTDVKAARALYQKLNPGSTPADYDALLDARYAKTFANPVAATPAVPSPATPQRVVLEELFTGADCEPCVAPDLATEAALRHYGRDQVVVAVYHDNAPGPDPLTTTVSEDRGKFYGTGGSTPHLIVDGKELTIEEGSPSHAQSTFDILTKAIDPQISSHPTAMLSAVALRTGELVQVTVKVNAAGLPPKTHLEILLLETEVSDTGKNTLRFQPMVVRAAAKMEGGEIGLALGHEKSSSHSYTFDLKKVEADNLAYYDHYRDELEKRLAQFIAKGYMTKAKVDDEAKFREPRNQINPDRLAVVAFLQNDDTKEVFQSSYSAVTGSQKGETP